MTRRVLVAFDESQQAHAALRYALTTFPEADVVAVHVSDPREWSVGTAMGYGYHSQEDFERARASAEELLDEAGTIARALDREVETVSEIGPVADTILAYAEDHEVDQIVLGSHGRTGLARFLLGSVAERVTRHAPVSVTVVREAEAETPTQADSSE